MNQLVSIIIPCYNSGSFILETLESIENQTYEMIEIIIVNDGSTDNSVKLIESHKSKFSIKLIHQENNGVSSARNKGFQNSEGEYIIFLDADDILERQFIEERIKVFNENIEINCIGSKIKVFQSETSQMIDENYSIIDDIKNITLSYIPKTSTVPSSYMYRRILFSKNALIYNPKLQSTADRFMVIKYADQIHGQNIEKENACLRYRIHHNSMSNKLTKKLVFDNEIFYQELLIYKLIENRKHLIVGYKILFKSFFKLKSFLISMKYFLLFSYQSSLKLVKPKMATKEL